MIHCRQRNSFKIKVVSNGYYLTGKEEFQIVGWMMAKGEAFDLPRRVFVMLKSCLDVVLASTLAL